jgi:exonuclease VII small subunit
VNENEKNMISYEKIIKKFEKIVNDAIEWLSNNNVTTN